MEKVALLLKVLTFLQAGLPALAKIVEHYYELQNDTKLNETDRVKMIENLRELELPDKSEFKPE